MEKSDSFQLRTMHIIIIAQLKFIALWYLEARMIMGTFLIGVLFDMMNGVWQYLMLKSFIRKHIKPVGVLNFNI